VAWKFGNPLQTLTGGAQGRIPEVSSHGHQVTQKSWKRTSTHPNPSFIHSKHTPNSAISKMDSNRESIAPKEHIRLHSSHTYKPRESSKSSLIQPRPFALDPFARSGCQVKRDVEVPPCPYILFKNPQIVSLL